MTTVREQLAKSLRDARLTAGFDSQGKLATALHMSRSVINKAESGVQPLPIQTTVMAWAEVTNVDPAPLMDLFQRCKNGTPEWFMDYLLAEQQATRLQFYEVAVVPGLLQTEAYARAHEKSDAVVSQRLERQQQVLGRAQVTAVIDHRVLAFAIGSPAIMAELCAHLIELVESGKISLHVVPEGGNVGLAGSVAIASHNGVFTVNMGTFTRDITSTAPDVVDETLSAFDQVLGASLPADKSIEFVRDMEEKWKQQV